MSHGWSYDGQTGPENWGKSYPEADGAHQSPIDINSSSAEFDPKLATIPLTFTYDANCFVNVENTGHSFNVTAAPGAVSKVSGGPVSHNYSFLQFHMHWGQHDKEGSEHTVDGEAYAAELHVVNWNSQLYPNPSEAVKSNKHDGLIVLGVLFKAGKANPELDKILSALAEVPLKGQKTQLKEQLELKNLFPSVSSYWTYQGSLTTPPCTECVQWVVFKEPVEASREQLDALCKLNSVSDEHSCCENSRIRYNYRPVCNINERKVSKSFH